MDVVMFMYNLIDYSDNYYKTAVRLWEYYRDELAAAIVNFKSFKSKIIITGKTLVDGDAKDAKIIVPLKKLSNFWRILSINCHINLILTWSPDCAFFLELEQNILQQLYKTSCTSCNFINSR